MARRGNGSAAPRHLTPRQPGQVAGRSLERYPHQRIESVWLFRTPNVLQLGRHSRLAPAKLGCSQWRVWLQPLYPLDDSTLLASGQPRADICQPEVEVHPLLAKWSQLLEQLPPVQ